MAIGAWRLAHLSQPVHSADELVHRQLAIAALSPHVSMVCIVFAEPAPIPIVAERDEPLGKRVRDLLASLGAMLDRDDPLEPLEQ